MAVDYGCLFNFTYELEMESVVTTAKPRPYSPARAASTAAFNARMLV
jgi:hypothetical protein